MKNYLSFGGGVNSVALHLLLIDEGVEFESIFVNHGTDWPETYEYLEMFQKWLKHNGYRPITVILPIVRRKKIGAEWHTLIDFCEDRKNIPQQWPRWCTGDWKKDPINQYVEKPCFMMIGIDAGEARRARLSVKGGIEYRYPLIEHDINRAGCKEIIKKHGLAEPMKSGCYICPFQSRFQWIELRKKHPDLFCRAEQLEENSGRTFVKNQRLESVVNEKQRKLFKIDEFPPCECML